jgi:ATP-binding cassette subfamily C protein/ATP-binding cassette subfamily C protein LapB
MSGSLFHAARKALPQALTSQFVQAERSAADGGGRHAAEFVACLIPLLNARGWRGDPRHVAEAVPHFASDFDLEGFRNALANLNLTTTPQRTRQDRIDPDLLPCLFIPDAGPVKVLIAEDENGGLRIFDGRAAEYRDGDTGSAAGTAFYLGEGNPEGSPSALATEAGSASLRAASGRSSPRRFSSRCCSTF